MKFVESAGKASLKLLIGVGALALVFLLISLEFLGVFTFPLLAPFRPFLIGGVLLSTILLLLWRGFLLGKGFVRILSVAIAIILSAGSVWVFFIAQIGVCFDACPANEGLVRAILWFFTGLFGVLTLCLPVFAFLKRSR